MEAMSQSVFVTGEEEQDQDQEVSGEGEAGIGQSMGGMSQGVGTD